MIVSAGPCGPGITTGRARSSGPSGASARPCGTCSPRDVWNCPSRARGFRPGSPGSSETGTGWPSATSGSAAGGVGAAGSRSRAAGIDRAEADPCGGGRRAGSKVWLPERQRVLIGIDDTDTPENGATWTLAHNIARAVESDDDVYLSHTIVQLYPVRFRTKNCVGVVLEFASDDPARLIGRVRGLLEEYTLSDETGMAAFTGFDPAALRPFADAVKQGEVGSEQLASVTSTPGLTLHLTGRGVIGAIAAIPFFTRYEEALSLWDGPS